MVLSLKVLGEFALCDGEGREISLPTRKTRALLGYLALNADKPQRRERLISLLWSDRGERQARQSLNQALRSIRKLGGDDTSLIVSDGERVTLSSAALETDIGHFRVLLYDNPEAAVDLYIGDFLDGLWVADPAFEGWLVATRSELQAHACAALERAASAAAETGELERAVGHAARRVALDPLREDAHRLLMHLLYESGDRASALLQYRNCAELLEKELQIAPEAATQALFDKIRRNSGASAPAEITPTPLKTSPPLSNKPSIAVLPFANLSGDPDQALLADGMAEDIITGLSRIRWLVVIARSSTFAYKGQSLDVRQIGHDLGVRYVLEGSVRKGGDQIRVSAQLIDTDTGSHIWAETFDRAFKAIFEIQDEITDAIVGALGPQIDRTERVRIKRKPPENVDAWTQYQLALIAYHTGTLESLKAAIEMFDRAAEMDPGFASAYAMGGACRNRLVINHGMENSKSVLEEAGRRLSTSVDLDPQDATCRCIYGVWLALHGKYDLALDSLAKAVELSPSSAEAHFFNANVLRRAGRPEEAIASVDRACLLSPSDARIAGFYTVRAGCLFDLERYDECAIWAQRAMHSPNPRSVSFLLLASALYYLERSDEAKAALEELKATYPNFTYASFLRTRRGHSAESIERYAVALRSLGFSE